MKKLFNTWAIRRMLPILGMLLLGGAAEVRSQALNTLTQAQKDSGWVLLFDGKSLLGWHKKQETVTASSWVVNEEAISRSTGGNLYSPVTAESFEFSIDWKLKDENGNSGIWLRIMETISENERSGPEIQIVGKLHADYGNTLTTVGACYAMYGPDPVPATWVKPAGQWNNFRVIMNGKHVEHWGNGVKVVEYDIGSADWLARQSRAKDQLKNSRYGEVHYGSFVLTDHQSPVWYRNIKVRPLAGTQIKSAFPGFVVPTPTAIFMPYRHADSRALAAADYAGGNRLLLSLDGRTLSYRPQGRSNGIFVAKIPGAERAFTKVILPYSEAK